MLKIYGRDNSINVRKVLWCCEELGLPFEREDWGAGFRPVDTPEFLAMNPNGMIPVIDDDGFVLWESNSILRYLCNRHGSGHLYPGAPQLRARVDQWMDWQATELNNAWRYAFMALVRRSPAHQDAAQIKQAVQTWTHHMRMIETRLTETGSWIAGPHFTLADIPVGLSVNRWFATPIEHPMLPGVQRYFDALEKRPGFLKYGCNGMP